jgi:hypothetical protein
MAKCGQCRYAQFERTKSGRPVRDRAGLCAYPLPPPPSVLPVCFEYKIVRLFSIWPKDGSDCLCFEEAPDA